MSSPSTPSTRPHRRERGNVGLGYLALILIAALVCGAVVTAVPLAKVSAQMRCAVESILTLRWTFDCGADDAAGGGSGGDAGNGGDAGATPTSLDVGVLGAVCGQAGSVMAAEAIKVLTGIGAPLVGRVLVGDAAAARWDVLSFAGPVREEI